MGSRPARPAKELRAAFIAVSEYLQRDVNGVVGEEVRAAHSARALASTLAPTLASTLAPITRSPSTLTLHPSPFHSLAPLRPG